MIEPNQINSSEEPRSDGPKRDITVRNAGGKANKKKLAFIIVFILLTWAFVYVMMHIIYDNAECSSNPLVYGARKATNAGTPIECTCKVLKENYNDFCFNDDFIGRCDMTIRNDILYNINLSL